MCLFQQELAEAHEANARCKGLALDLREAPTPRSTVAAPESEDHLDSRQSSPQQEPESSRGASAVADAQVADAQVAAAQVADSQAASAASQGSLRTVAVMSLVVVAAVAAALSGVWALQTPPAAPPPLRVGVIAGHTTSGASVATSMSRVAAKPPNSTAAVLSMREQGLHYLRVSDCWQAEWFFRSAMKQLEEEDYAIDGWNITIANFSVSSLLGDRGFALVCAQRFDEGARLLEQSVLGDGLTRSPSHLVNALGYAHFRMRDYKRASEIFEKALKADPANPILWNNLAAAKMVGGDIQAADDALYHTFDHVDAKAQFQVEEYHMQIFHSNVQNLVSRVGGEKPTLPSIELWFPG